MPRHAAKKARAKASVEEPRATILINLYDGTRELLTPQTKLLLRIIDGEQRHVFTDFVKGPTIRVTVPFQDGLRDTYTVLASADSYLQASGMCLKRRTPRSPICSRKVQPAAHRLSTVMRR